jgi:hypothetical protein
MRREAANAYIAACLHDAGRLTCLPGHAAPPADGRQAHLSFIYR